MTRLEQLRTDLGLTQVGLAKVADVSHATISRIEGGKPASPATLKKLADYLGVPASDLGREALPVREVAA